MRRKFIFSLAAALSSLLLTGPAFAAEGGDGQIGAPGAGRYSIERVLNAMEDLVDVMEQVFAIMISNPLLLVLLAAGLLSLGVWIFKKVKGAAK